MMDNIFVKGLLNSEVSSEETEVVSSEIAGFAGGGAAAISA
jgi:hypothetical protein